MEASLTPSHGKPEAVNGHDMDAILCGVGAWPGTERDAGDEAGPEGISKFPQRLEVAARDPVARLDLESDNSSFVVFDDEVHLVAVMGAPMADSHGLLQPGDLLSQFVDDEGLEQVSEL